MTDRPLGARLTLFWSCPRCWIHCFAGVHVCQQSRCPQERPTRGRGEEMMTLSGGVIQLCCPKEELKSVCYLLADSSLFTLETSYECFHLSMCDRKKHEHIVAFISWPFRFPLLILWTKFAFTGECPHQAPCEGFITFLLSCVSILICILCVYVWINKMIFRFSHRSTLT